MKFLNWLKPKTEILNVSETVKQPEIHKQKSDLSKELLKLHKSAVTINTEAKKMQKIIDTATRIAMATGAIKI